jgi:hypothetical protein
LKTLRVSDGAHAKLTALLGTLMAQSGKMRTYTDSIEALLDGSVVLPPELLHEVEKFIVKNKELGFATTEDFLRDAVRFRLQELSGRYRYVKVLRDEYEKCESAIKEMGLPFSGVAEYIQKEIETLILKREKEVSKQS